MAAVFVNELLELGGVAVLQASVCASACNAALSSERSTLTSIAFLAAGMTSFVNRRCSVRSSLSLLVDHRWPSSSNCLGVTPTCEGEHGR